MMSSDFPRVLYPMQYEDIVRTALTEDLGRGGDLTSDAVVATDQSAAARIISREAGRIAGVEVALSVFRNIDRMIDFEVVVADGAAVNKGSTVVALRGSARSILTAERTALNFLGRLSGVATLTGLFVSAVEGTGARIVCTRKTTPGLRALEKYAVRCGGGWNHRFGLDDAVLIKDNHLAAAGGVHEAVDRVRRAVGHTVSVEVEVDTLDQLEQVLAEGVDAVLLDNMDTADLRRAVELVGGRVVTEASGGITLENVAEVARTGVDLISVGALTHSANALDLSLELELVD
jgi:nicotinate-nucleotide pyrophosphorylase (carboxylating)